MTEQLVRVEAPHFVAGIVMVGDVCTEAAPILRWAAGHSRGWLSTYFKNMGWKAMIVQSSRVIDCLASAPVSVEP